jgi:hypothetical protein
VAVSPHHPNGEGLYLGFLSLLMRRGEIVTARIGLVTLFRVNYHQPQTEHLQQFDHLFPSSADPISPGDADVHFRGQHQPVDYLRMISRLRESLSSTEAGGVSALLEPGEYPPRTSKHRRERLLGEFAKRAGNPNLGEKVKRRGVIDCLPAESSCNRPAPAEGRAHKGFTGRTDSGGAEHRPSSTETLRVVRTNLGWCV